MTQLLTAVSLLFSFPLAPLADVGDVPGGMTVEHGLLSQYAEQPTVDTIWYRQSVGQLPTELPENAVFIAVADCDWIGRQGLISIAGNEWEPLWVYDCAGSAQAYDWLVSNGFLGEIDYYAAERHDVICRCPVEGRVIWLN